MQTNLLVSRQSCLSQQRRLCWIPAHCQQQEKGQTHSIWPEHTIPKFVPIYYSKFLYFPTYFTYYSHYYSSVKQYYNTQVGSAELSTFKRALRGPGAPKKIRGSASPSSTLGSRLGRSTIRRRHKQRSHCVQGVVVAFVPSQIWLCERLLLEGMSP